MKPQNLTNGKALSGHDAVSIYNMDAVLGRSEFSTEFKGAIYQFSSAENKKRFDQNSKKYVPKYGGYCSIAIGEGALVDANPHSSLVQDGELHVFYKDEEEDTQDEWNENPIEFKKQAETAWMNL